MIQEWHRERATQEIVKREIQKILNDTLPLSYDRNVFVDKTETVFRHFYDMAEMGVGFVAN